MVTHDLKSALRGNRFFYLKDGTIYGECHLEAYHGPDDLPRLEKLRSFLIEMGW
jgi:putative ABC transport system ATP-binding protein